MPCVGDGGGLDRGGALERAQQGRSPGARPGPGSGPATPETLNNAQRTTVPVGRAEPRSGVGLAGAKKREAGDVTRTTRFSGAKEEGGAHQA